MKKTKIIAIILGIILISLISFLGIYVKKQNRMEEITKEYNLGMSVRGSRVVDFKVSDETVTTIKDSEGNIINEELTDEEITEKGYTKEVTTLNNDERYSLEDYKNSKAVLEKRLKQFGVGEYIIRLNEKTGMIEIEIPENSATDHIVSNIGQASQFQIVDSQTKEVLMDNNDLKKVNVMYGRASEENNNINVYLSYEFTKEGANKLTDITSKYVKIENEKEEETQEEAEEATTENEKEEEKTITMKIDESEVLSTSFETPITNGIIQLTMGAATSDEEQLQENMKSATTIATLLNSGKLPVKYEVYENKYVLSNMQDLIKIVILALGAFALVLLVLLSIKYKSLGFLCGITSVGLLAIVLLLIRYTNIELNLETIFAIITTMILNFVFLVKILKNTKYSQDLKQGINNVFKKFLIQIIPISIISIVFSFVKWNPIYSFGLTMFWGVIVIAIYNYLITRTVILIKENK